MPTVKTVPCSLFPVPCPHRQLFQQALGSNIESLDMINSDFLLLISIVAQFA